MKAKKKIMIVDDNHDILDLLELFLYSTYDVFTASNGFEGMTKAKETPPDAIITDIMMPGMDGIALFNNCRKTESLAAIPIIAVTSFDKKTNTKSLTNMGFTSVMVKPLKRETILETVKKALVVPRPGKNTRHA
jgi:CheY-like chemotaxis protein